MPDTRNNENAGDYSDTAPTAKSAQDSTADNADAPIENSDINRNIAIQRRVVNKGTVNPIFSEGNIPAGVSLQSPNAPPLQTNADIAKVKKVSEDFYSTHKQECFLEDGNLYADKNKKNVLVEVIVEPESKGRQHAGAKSKPPAAESQRITVKIPDPSKLEAEIIQKYIQTFPPGQCLATCDFKAAENFIKQAGPQAMNLDFTGNLWYAQNNLQIEAWKKEAANPKPSGCTLASPTGKPK